METNGQITVNPYETRYCPDKGEYTLLPSKDFIPISKAQILLNVNLNKKLDKIVSTSISFINSKLSERDKNTLDSWDSFLKKKN